MATISQPNLDKSSSDSADTSPSYRLPFSIMTVLFFMWGFMTVWNDILIPRFKEAFTLSYFQAMLVQFAFFGAYAIGPLIGGWLIFKVFSSGNLHGAESVKIPYLCVGGLFIALAVFFKFAHIPNFTNEESITRGAGALKHPHTALGILAIFMYVGGEVAVGSAVIDFLVLPELGGLPHEAATYYLAFFWGGLMFGRFMGAFALSSMKRSTKNLLMVATPCLAFLAAVTLTNWNEALHYGVPLILLLLAFFLGQTSAQRMLVLFSLLIIGLLGAGMITSDETAKWAILGIGLFCSVMWSNIFSLAIEGLGPHEESGVVPVGDGHSEWRAATSLAGHHRGQVGYPTFIHRSDDRLCLHHLLRPLWLSRQPRLHQSCGLTKQYS